MSGRSRLFIANGLLLMAAVGGTLLAFEVALRIALPQKLYRYPRHLFRSDPDVGFVLNPGFEGDLSTPEFHTHLKINSLGFRNGEIAAKPPQAARILFVGDSFVSALNVEADQTFVSVAGRALERSLGSGRVDVVNAGTPNYGTWHELGILRRFARSLETDLAVLCVFVGNDLEDNLRPEAAVVRDGLLVERAPRPGFLPRPLRAWLQRNSMAYVFLWNAWDRVRDGVTGRAQDPLHGFGALLDASADARVEEGYRRSAVLLKEAKELLASSGIPLLVVIIPQELQVYPETFSAIAARGGEGTRASTEYDLDRPNRRWKEIAESAGLPVLDLLPVLRGRNGGPPLYMRLDGHLTTEGNRIAGEAIAAALVPLVATPGAQP